MVWKYSKNTTEIFWKYSGHKTSTLWRRSKFSSDVYSRSGNQFSTVFLRSWGHLHKTEFVRAGVHHPERPSPILSLRDNLCPDRAIFRIVSRERLSPLRSTYGRNQRGKGQKWLRKTDEGCGTSLWPPFFSALSSAKHGPQWRQKFAGKHISKNSSIWAQVGSQIQCRWTLRAMGSW